MIHQAERDLLDLEAFFIQLCSLPTTPERTELAKATDKVMHYVACSMEPDPCLEAEMANERYFEDRGFWDWEHERAVEEARGVVSFRDAMEAACGPLD